MDHDYTHARLMAALKGIAAGKVVCDTVPVPPYGTSTKIFAALNDAAKHLDETFAADHLALVDQALTKLGLARTNDKKNEIALAILTALVPPNEPSR
jgi:hypothetical protein